MKHLTLLAAFIAALFFALGTPGAMAQIAPLASSEEVKTPAPEKDLYGRDTPRGLMFGYLQAISAGNYELAGRYLAMPESSESFRLARSTRLARDFEDLLDRAGALNDNWTISSLRSGNPTDGHREGVDQIGKIVIGDATIPILAEITKRDGQQFWQISRETVDRIPDLLALTSASLVDRVMPLASRSVEVLSVPVSHILFSSGAALALWGMVLLAMVWVHRSIEAIAKRRKLDTYLVFVNVARRPITAIAALALLLPTLELSGVSVVLRGFLSPVIDVAISLAAAWIALGVADALFMQAIGRAQLRGHVGSISFLSLGRRAVRVSVFFIALLVALSTIGVDLTAGLAALGIGGIAIALGSQKTIEHFVGSLTVVADRVVRIGDFCRFGTTLGTIEDIGIRSTRIRTLNRTIVTVPNGVFSSVEIENYTSRDKFLFKHVLTLAPGATRDQITSLLEDLRSLLEADPDVDEDPRRVRLVSLDHAMPRIEVFAYVHAADWNEFLLRQENLILKVMAAIENSGTRLSAPLQDIRMEPLASGEARAPEQSPRET